MGDFVADQHQHHENHDPNHDPNDTSSHAKSHDVEELFFDQLKDQFAFFYAVTMAGIEVYHYARRQYRQKHGHDTADTVTKS